MTLPAVRWSIATSLLLMLTFAALSQERRDALQVEVPFEPTAFASADGLQSAYELAAAKADEPLRLHRVDASDTHQPRSKPRTASAHLAYELVLTNIGSAPLTLQRIQIADGSRRSANPIAVYEGAELEALLAFPERQHSEADDNRLHLKPTQRVVVILFLSFQDRKLVPTTLRHHVYTTDTVVEVARIGTRRSQIPVLGPPLKGGEWFVLGGPGATGATTYHRQNTFMFNGHIEATRRYAIHWVKIQNGEMQSGPLADNASYYSYGQEVLAVAEGVVATRWMACRTMFPVMFRPWPRRHRHAKSVEITSC